MSRRTWSAALVSAALLIGLPGTALAEAPPLPDSMAAVGDSITRAASTGGELGTDYPANSWSTGTNTTVNSHYARILAQQPEIQDRQHNLAVSGAKVVDLQDQMEAVGTVDPEYLTVLIGGNDICTDTEAQMTSVEDFRAQFQAAMATLTQGSPTTNVYVVSIPRVLGLWELFRNDWFARLVWSAGDICQSLLANPTSTQTADVERRARVHDRNVAFNQVLAEVCQATPRCLWDGWAVFNTPFVRSDVSGDYFHPSTSGQAKLARVTWDHGYWAAKIVSLAAASGSARSVKNGWTATVTVAARDELGSPVAGASITGTWSTSGSGGCTTLSTGTCSFSVNLGKRVTSTTWTVGGITHATLAYDPAANLASSVTIRRP